MKPGRSATGTVLIAFLLCPTSALLWVGRWKLAIAYFALHAASTVLVVWLAHVGFEPLHMLAQRRPEYVLYVGNALAAVPTAWQATRQPAQPAGWHSGIVTVIAAYAAIGISFYKFAKPWLG